MIEIEAYVPQNPTPTDLDGYTAYVMGAIALNQPVQVPDYLLVAEPKLGSCTEVSRPG